MGWYPQAHRLPGPPAKVGYGDERLSPKLGVIVHSAEGTWQGMVHVLNHPLRRASWHFSLRHDGHVAQHYDTDVIAWHGGSRLANTRYVGIEAEGRAPGPLTSAQVSAVAALIAWLRGLYEHREMTELGSPPTACPSGRIPWDEIIAQATRPGPPPPSLTDQPHGLAGPLEAYILVAGTWQKTTVKDYHQAVVGFWEGWLVPLWLHDKLFKEVQQ
jgi:hypothetical protein